MVFFLLASDNVTWFLLGCTRYNGEMEFYFIWGSIGESNMNHDSNMEGDDSNMYGYTDGPTMRARTKQL